MSMFGRKDNSHPDDYGSTPGAQRHLSNVLKAVDEDLEAETRNQNTMIKTETRLEEIARLVKTLPFDEMCIWGKLLEENKPDVEAPPEMKNAMMLNAWCKQQLGLNEPKQIIATVETDRMLAQQNVADKVWPK